MMLSRSNRDCTGCFACANTCPVDCIEMIENEEGFLYPVTNEAVCIKCGCCINVCPVLRTVVKENCAPTAYSIHNKNSYIRKESSSGGVFSALAASILEQGGTVYGARFDEKWDVVHDKAVREEQLKPFRTSKYVQSKIGTIFADVKEQLSQGNKVLFTGTECQIAGLKSFLKQEYDGLLYCQGLVCHGVPSSKVWRQYIEYQEKRYKSKISSICFRNKNTGWEDHSMRLEFANGKTYSQLHQFDLMFRAFLSNVCLRPCCYECKFKVPNMQSDITLADFWDVDRYLPHKRENKGESLVLVHTARGKKLIESVKDSLNVQPVELELALKAGTMIQNSVPYNERREAFFWELVQKPLKEIMDDFYPVTTKAYIKGYLYYLLKRLRLYYPIKTFYFSFIKCN